MTQYISVDRFTDLTVMPESYVTDLEMTAPGWLAKQIEVVSALIDSRLRKRYLVPFVSPIPVVVELWVTRLVTQRAMLRLGIDPTDAQNEQIRLDAEAANAELKEAADAQNGLFDLPLLVDITTSASAVAKGAPFVYSESSPYTWTDRQRDGFGDV